MSPRSILKRSSCRQSSSDAQPHVVHFPPSPSLCSTFSAYSPSLYDRSPIVVSQNVCALPERGGRTYHISDSTTHSTPRSPRSEASRAYRSGLPQLVPDISSSESDESDTFVYPSQVTTTGIYSYGAYGLPTSKYEYDSSVYSPTTEEPSSVDALSFLPYPPSPPHDRSSRSRRAIDMDRIRRDNHSGSSIEEERPIASSPPKKRSCSRRREYLSKLSAGGPAAYGMSDDGCLGGF